MATRYPLVISGTQIQELQTGDTLLGSVANITGGSAGQLPYQSAANTTGFTAAGTSGQYLQSTGAGAPTWATPSGGAMVFLSSQTISTAVNTVSFTGLSTYDQYRLVVKNLQVVSIATVYVKVGTGSGPTYMNLRYQGVYGNQNYLYALGNTDVLQIPLTGGSGLGPSSDGNQCSTIIDFTGFLSTTTCFGFIRSWYEPNSGQNQTFTSNFRGTSGAASTAIQITTLDQNFTGGSFYLYGIKTS